MADKDTRNFSAQGAGRTSQQIVDDWQKTGGGCTDGGCKGPLVPQKIAPTNIHPSTPGGHNYGAPVGDVILK